MILLEYYFFIFFSVRLLSVWSFGFFIPATTANDLRLWRIFYPRFYPLHLFSYLNSWERASIFPFECSVPNKSTTGTIIITTLAWLGIAPGTSRTRSQHSTTRLSRRRWNMKLIILVTRAYRKEAIQRSQVTHSDLFVNMSLFTPLHKHALSTHYKNLINASCLLIKQ